MTKLNRAYSTFAIKAMDDAGGKRTFTGIASTVSADRSNDVVEPKGMQVKLPAPLLWQHDSKQPIGWVTAARVTDKSIEVDCEIADIQEAGPLKERLDTAWQSIKAKLVRGLSIGFNPLESARIEGTYGYRYLQWELLELSAVTVPANGDCSITSIKSLDQQLRRTAFGAGSALPVVRLDHAGPASKSTPGVTGSNQARRPGVVYIN